jgi:hypothetical protein
MVTPAAANKVPSVVKCHNNECNNDARWQVSFWMLPLSKSDLEPTRRNIAVTTSTVVCDNHRKSIRYDDITSPEGRAHLNNYLVSNNKDPLDFTTARPTFTELIGEELPLPSNCIFTNPHADASSFER